MMTPPKKWYLQLASNRESLNVATVQNLVLVNSEGLIKKQNAAEPLGNVKKVSFVTTLTLLIMLLVTTR